MGKQRWPGFGPRLKAAIAAAGYVNEHGDADVLAFALAIGYHPNYIYRWINETTFPERDNLLKLAEALKVHPAVLMFGEDDIYPTGAGPLRKLGVVLAIFGAGLVLWPSSAVATTHDGVGQKALIIAELAYFVKYALRRLWGPPRWTPTYA